jgi:hypothetical protein
MAVRAPLQLSRFALTTKRMSAVALSRIEPCPVLSRNRPVPFRHPDAAKVRTFSECVHF